MNLPINQVLIDDLKTSSGFQDCTLNEAEQIHQLLADKRAKIIVINADSYIVFAELSSVEFKVRAVNKRTSFNFVTDQDLVFIAADDSKFNYFKFLCDEFLQGKRWYSKIWRLITTLVPLAILNIIGIYFADSSGIKDVVSGILAAVSIFVAIFSLFTTSQEYLSRKRLALFEKGKLGYYFAIDQYVTRTGVYTIILSVFTLLICTGFNSGGAQPLYKFSPRNSLVILGLNLCFLGVFLTLRTINEFYVKRPGKFIMGDMKKESFEAYRQEIH